MKLFIALLLIPITAFALGSPGLINDSSISPTAAIQLSKLKALAASSVVFTGADGKLVAGQFIGDVQNNGSTVTIYGIQGTAVTGTTGTGNAVLATAPTLTNVLVGTQASSDNSTTAASTAYVQTALAQLNPAAVVVAASTANVPGTYTNAVGGVCIGDTFLVTATTAFAPDGVTLTTGQRFLFKDQSSTFQNGAWTLTTAANVGVLGALLTRALDFDSSADINAGQIIPVSGGTVNAGSSWYQTANNTTCNSSVQTWTQFQKASSAYLAAANNLSDLANISTARTNLAALTSNLTSANIFVGNASNQAASVVMTGDVAISNTGVTTIQAGAVTLSKMASIANNSVLGNTSGGSAAPAALGVSSLLDVLSSTAGQTLQRGANTWVGSTVAVTPCSAISASSVDWSLGNCFTKTLSANTTLTFANKTPGQNVVLRITNTNSNYTLTFPNTSAPGASVLWSGSTIPVMSTGQHTDIFTVFFDGVNYYGNSVQNF